MKHHDLVKNPLFKIFGVAMILYFALFSNNSDNRSMGRRYSSENIKESFSEATRKKKEIERKLSEAKKLKAQLDMQNKQDNNSNDENEKK